MPSTNNNNKELLKYAGLTMEFFAAIGLSIFLGFKIDKWLNWGFPLSAWLLPVLIIIGIIIKVFKDTSRKK